MRHEDLNRSVHYEIEDLTLDVGQCRLTRAGQPLALTKLNFLVLLCLVEAAPNVVSHAKLASRVWGERRIITQENLGKRIMLLRQMLGDSADRPRYIEAVRGLGYRLVAQVRRIDPAASAAADGDAPVIAEPAARRPRFFARRRAALTAALGLLVAAAIWWRAEPGERAPVPASSAPSVAVLPFADRSPGGDQEYLAFGIADEISGRLARIPQLRVIGRTSSLALAKRVISPLEAARSLGVTHVVEGSLHRDGDRLRILTSLLDTRSGEQAWSGEFTGDAGQAFALQDDIAARLVAELHLALSPAPVDRSPKPNVYASYLQARHINRNLIAASLPRARSLLESAIAEDPSFFPARRELVASYNILLGSRLIDRDRARELLRATIDDAAALWPERLEIDFWRGWYAVTFDGDLASAARHFQRSLEGPVNLDTLPVLVDFTMRLNRLEEAIVIGEYLLERDPICFFCYYNLMIAYHRAERYDKVRELYFASQALGFEHTDLKIRYGLALLELNEGEEALRTFDSVENWEDVPRDARSTAYAMAYGLLGRKAEFDAALSETHDPLRVGMVYAFTGDLAAAFATFDSQPTLPPQLLDGRVGDRMRKHERWPELAAKAQMSPHDPRDDIPFDISSLRLPQ